MKQDTRSRHVSLYNLGPLDRLKSAALEGLKGNKKIVSDGDAIDARSDEINAKHLAP